MKQPIKQPTEQPPHAPQTSLVWIAVLAMIVIAGAGLRIAGARGDLWLDEIWSWNIANDDVASYAEIFTKAKIDNNHFLNTIILRAIGHDASMFAYRVPAILAGVGSIVFAGLIGWRQSNANAVIAALLVSVSYLMVHYSSEARGYAFLMFFCLVCHYALIRAIASQSYLWPAWYAVAAVFGLLSHLTFVCLLAGHAVWLVTAAARKELPPRRGLIVGAIQFILPTLCLLWLWKVNLSEIVKGGGDMTDLKQKIVEAFSLLVGAPITGWFLVIGLLAGFLIVVVSVWKQIESDVGQCAAYFGVLTALGLSILVASEGFIYVRYFLVALPATYLLIAGYLTQLWEKDKSTRLVCAVLLVLFVVGNLYLTSQLIEKGRGQYSAALEMMRNETEGDAIFFASDEPAFRNLMLLRFYDQRSPSKKRLNPEDAQLPQWVIFHSQELDFQPDRYINDPAGNRYRLHKVFPYSNLSGWNWAVYKRVE